LSLYRDISFFTGVFTGIFLTMDCHSSVSGGHCYFLLEYSLFSIPIYKYLCNLVLPLHIQYFLSYRS
jgi:hypothetical protein